MKLRWFQVRHVNKFDEFKKLQYWDTEEGRWKNIPLVCVHEKDEEEALKHKVWIGETV
mgnify:CR=1 FL=1